MTDESKHGVSVRVRRDCGVAMGGCVFKEQRMEREFARMSGATVAPVWMDDEFLLEIATSRFNPKPAQARALAREVLRLRGVVEEMKR